MTTEQFSQPLTDERTSTFYFYEVLLRC